jgi:hypothetical protein
MKKLLFVLALLMLATPAMAAVTLTCASAGPNSVTFGYSTDGELVRAFALDITTDLGVITEVTSASTAYRIYPGTIDINAAGEVEDYGTPVAPSGDPGALGGLGTSGVTVEMASLYGPNDANANPTYIPGTSGDLVTVYTSVPSPNVTATVNTTRGNVVLEDTTSVSPSSSTCIAGECYPSGLSDHGEWVSVGRPDSWCYPKQCHGDATGTDEFFGRTNKVSVGGADVAILLQGYNLNVSEYSDPTSDPWIAADFDHDTEFFGRTNEVRVGGQDVAILLSYYNDPCSTVPADCLSP